ncbi:MAG TPA: Gfo/Idh/MocA family oxidoreductase [Pseudolabrys sp.]|nr:Gfo/Idh/MocA family oxidoreductase [Pseudolabrys sp.]
MAAREIGIIVNGATGRIGSTQHLAHALVPIRTEGGLPAGDERIVPRPLLLGRDRDRLAAVARSHGIAEWTTDLDAALANPEFPIFFDAAATHQRVPTLSRAIAAGKHIYSEKPVAPTAEQGLALLRAAEKAGLKTGAVEDKVYLPGLQKIARLAGDGFFGRIVGFKLDFGWWVFDGIEAPSQRPSWNYHSSGGGGLTLDMYPHWRYVIEDIVGRVRRIVTSASTAIGERADESGKRFKVDVDDRSITLAELENGAVGTIISTWATRVRRDDLMTLQIDGTGGSAVAGLHRCWVQSKADTPTVRHFNPDKDIDADYRADWREFAGEVRKVNPYRVGWEDFLRHVVVGAPLRATFAAGIRDVQFAEASKRSASERRWVEIDEPAA